MKPKQIIIGILLLFFHSISGQIKCVKIDTIYDSQGNIHRVIGNRFDENSNYYNLAIQCKKKADSLLKKHFNNTFFSNQIILNVRTSYWEYEKPIFKDYYRNQLCDNKYKVKPKKIKLEYSYLDKKFEFPIISIWINCYKNIEIIEAYGIPKKTNYKIEINYLNALKIVKENKFKTAKKSNSHINQRLFLEYYKGRFWWKISNLIDVKYKKSFRVYLKTKVLYINVNTGKIKKKKKKIYKGIRKFI